jgi:penicillin amidase
MIKKILKIATVLVILCALMGLGGWFYVRSSLPNYDGSVAVAGLGTTAKIVRDKDAVAHIFAANQNDAAFALGYAHAQDRLWQLEMNRRIGQGRLAEILGSDAVKTDKFIRVMGFYRLAQKNYENAAPATRKTLQSYAAGINAYVATRKGALPIEFIALKTNFAPWTPVDSLVWGKLMSLDLGYQWRTELGRFTLASRLPIGRINELIPPYPGDLAVNMPDPKTLYPGLLPPEIKAEEVEAKGSNNWVVSGARTVSGKPLLANDPHLTLTAPGIWYLVHMRMGDKNVVGVSMPSLPYVTLGRTDNLAWGFTNTAPDAHDIIVEKIIDPATGTYQTPDGTAILSKRREVIKVKNSADIFLTVRSSRNGPLLSDAIDDLGARMGKNYVMALRWTALSETDSTLDSGLAMNTAQTVAQGIAAVRGFTSPQQNIVMADTQGNIGYIAAGQVPQRSADHLTQGVMPVPGWLKSSEWTGFIPFEKLPQVVNPASGYVATANQKIVGPDYPLMITRDWEDPFRQDRIVSMLEATPKHNIASFSKMQADIISEPMKLMRDALVNNLASSAKPQADLIAALKKWDGTMAADQSVPLILAAWHRHFVKRVTSDDLGGLFKDYWRTRTRFVLGILANNASSTYWCNDIKSPNTETCAAQIKLAFEDAMTELNKEYGTDWKRWKWGTAHQVVAEHRPFSEVPQLASRFNIRRNLGGYGNTVNVAHAEWKPKRPYDTTLIASYRGIFDLSNLDNSRFIIPNGQSGNVLSKHYADFADRWAAVEYITVPTKDADIAKITQHTLTLTPR